ncbi:hypothetical protein SYNPS1DRAFT_32147 [Syncephalis pseudoplumigaleata]|uniref:F-box domain-containing protein n=1 Tax=Syncephalis pseudoplumigaleata TaxID=1712513 RepID=A0A4P9YRG5_9FUNG|nr:hypothetical protein SYNPS1DRAFT_32147 [Syncephalis pseudoplumigaleata]|eukprot:RKP22275.1 hypothetical protein SYNPS1DRAFT_32147 [Syncephalis pseudoplumigaleata]
MTVLEDLPNELLLRLAGHLSVQACFRLARCSLRFRRVLFGYRALGRRLYGEAFPATQSENELLGWLLATDHDADEKEEDAVFSSSCMIDIDAVADEKKEEEEEEEEENARDRVHWWRLLQRRGQLEWRWRTLSPTRLPLPTPPGLSGNEDISVLCARPWGMLLAVNEEHSRLFWMPKSAMTSAAVPSTSTWKEDQIMASKSAYAYFYDSIHHHNGGNEHDADDADAADADDDERHAAIVPDIDESDALARGKDDIDHGHSMHNDSEHGGGLPSIVESLSSCTDGHHSVDGNDSDGSSNSGNR